MSDLIQRHMNHFPELEDGAEELWKKAELDPEELYPGLVRYLDAVTASRCASRAVGPSAG